VARPPSGPLWVHEIKHDGYRLMVRRDGASAVRRVEMSPGHLRQHFIDARLQASGASLCGRQAAVSKGQPDTVLAPSWGSMSRTPTEDARGIEMSGRDAIIGEPQ
jgi:hypothetical protein